MAIIKSGASTDLMTIDVTSKAARVTPYDSIAVNRGVKRTYRACTATTFTTASSAVPFFVISGSATTVIRVQRIVLSGVLIAAVAYATLELGKYSTAAFTGGTAVVMTQVPMDSNSAAASATLVQVYTAAPTAGTLVGIIDSKRFLVQSTTAAAAGIPETFEFDFRYTGEAEPPVLRGSTQSLALNWEAAASNVVGAVMVEWTEE